MMFSLRGDVERWLTHADLPFGEEIEQDYMFKFAIKHTGQTEIPIEIFEPKAQQGVLVIGAKVNMKDGQTARYLNFSNDEKESFDRKVADYCSSIRAVNRNTTENGKRKIGVYVVLDREENLSQQGLYDAIDKVSDMYQKMARFLMKTF